MRIDGARTLNPGRLNHRITWQEKFVSGHNSFGEDVFSYRDLITCACDVKELQGQELDWARQRWGEARYEITQHFNAGLKRVHRGLWFVHGENRLLDIVGPLEPLGIGLMQTIYAKEWAE